MKIYYSSCHSVLEHDEVKLLTEMGHEVRSNGAYRDPGGAYTLPRPGIPGMAFDQRFFDLTAQYPKTEIPQEIIDWADCFIFMSGDQEGPVLNNWEHIRHKRVIWRTIGQSVPEIEVRIAPLKAQGLQIVRYSPKERNLAGYAGEDVLIRFYKDPAELHDWTGHDARLINFTQSLQGRGAFTHYSEIMQVFQTYPGKVYGTGNNDLGGFNGGELPWELMKGLLRDCRVFLYTGTWPAAYTLSFIEAWMTGIPIAFRLVGYYLIMRPIPNGVWTFYHWYVPACPQVGASPLFAFDAINGWDEYIVLDGCIKVLAQQQMDCSVYMAQKDALRQRIVRMAPSRTMRAGHVSRVRYGSEFRRIPNVRF